MRLSRWTVIAGSVGMAVVAACARVTTNVRRPLSATLSPGAQTGAPVALRFDPNAKVILSNASALPPASFLPSQATRGEQLYRESCATCHAQGTLVGRGFVESWNGRRVYDLYALIHGTMPLDKPGGLKDQEYVDVVAYLLQANRAPAGADSLRADTLTLRNTSIAVSVP
jgi:mono/diheme cytochrome c family protein